jgi:predicted ATPase/class 3 adenylate cyclase
LRDLHVRSLQAQAEGHLIVGRTGSAVAAAREAVALDELREGSYRLLMRALAAAGERGEALRVWERCRITLTDELGIDPSSETEAVYLSLLGESSKDSPASPALPTAPEPTQRPTGVVTFLLTDIAGSTRLWEADQHAMALALARHDELIADAVARYGGQLLKTRGEGDSTFSVFASVSHAAAAAIHIQRAIDADSIGGDLALRVRASMHTGEAELRDDDYFGPAVNRAARLRAIAHGGQVLCSQASARLLEDRLPEGASLRGLGSHRLQDLARPEAVYQLCHTALEIDFPPLQSLESLPNNLPVQLTSFIGREQEIVELTEILTDNRLVTLTGAAGCGKTRLAVHLGGERLRDFPDGVWLIDLAPLADPELLLQTVVTTLGVREPPATAVSAVANVQQSRSLVDLLIDHLRNRSLLLVLDNCEHLLDAVATLAEGLLRSCPQLRILATSREPLGVGGEVTWRARSLAVPARTQLPLPQLCEYEAVRLFIDRARSCIPSFELTEADGPAVAQICRRLDGIPLAIELAAARVEVLAPRDLAARLDDRFRVLTGGSRTGLERHQTLRAAVDWSYDALPAAEQALLQRLSVFAGGCTLDAAEAVCAGGAVDGDAVLELLSRLVAKSLVTMDRDASPARYRMLETIRQYARDKLDADSAIELRARHLQWCLQFADQAARGIWGREQLGWFERLEAEEDNVRQSLEWTIGGGDAESALHLVGALGRFWMVRQRVNEGLRWTLEALALDSDRFPFLRAQALVSASLSLVGYFGAYEQALHMARESLELFDSLGIRRGRFWALCTVSITSLFLGDLAAAASYGDEAVDAARGTGHSGTLVYGLLNRADVAIAEGRFELVDALLAETLPLLRETDDNIGLVRSLGIHAFGAIRAGDYAAAMRHLKETVERSREIGDNSSVIWGLANLGCVALVTGELAAARSWFGQAQSAAGADMESFAMAFPFVDRRAEHGATPAAGGAAMPTSDPVRLGSTDSGLVARMVFRHSTMADMSLKIDAASSMSTESVFLDIFLRNGLAELALADGDLQRAAVLLCDAIGRLGAGGRGPGDSTSMPAVNPSRPGIPAAVYSMAWSRTDQAPVCAPEPGPARHSAPRGMTVAEQLGVPADPGGARVVTAATGGLGELILVPSLLATTAKLAAAQGQPEAAARTFGAADQVRNAMAAPQRDSRMILFEHGREESMATARKELGDDAFDAAYAEGEAMSSEEAINYAAELLIAALPSTLPT